jgi:hypothetical protein
MKAVLVFCEGRHDVVFVQRSLGSHLGCTFFKKPIGTLPSPFGKDKAAAKGLIARRFERQALEGLTLQAAAHPPHPRFESVLEHEASSTMYFMVRAQGQDQPDAILGLLAVLNEMVTEEPPGTYDVSEYAAAFLFDADVEGVDATLATFRERFGEYFGDLTALEPGQWIATQSVPVGCFIFHKEGESIGTLEDHLAPMAESAWPDQYPKAQAFIDDNKTEADRVSAKESERLKAIITATGQFNHPGDPLSEILGWRGLSKAEFDEAPLSKAIVEFLAATPWGRSDAATQRRP